MIPHAENNRTDQNIQTELENFMAETENDEIERQEPAVAEIVGKAIFSQKYDEYAFFYQSAIRQLTTKLQIVSADFSRNNDRSPIESITSRVKSLESIAAKMEHKGLELNLDNMISNINDTAGIRVICPFLKDVYEVADMLLKQKDVELIKIKDYIKNPKKSGYRSLHLIVKTSVLFSDGIREIPVEIQIRTIAQNFFASTDHQIRYKRQSKITPEIHKKMLECAELMANADEQMQNLAEKVEI